MFTRMNPDFLYSSLALIRNKCDEDTFCAEELTVSLSKYLRQTLGFKQLKGIVPVGNELELIKAYISIEKAKDPRLSFELLIPDDLPEFNIPPLSIQPLLENAISHAFPESMQSGHIFLEIEPSDEEFTISVTDDGIGMTEDQITAALTASREDGKVGINSIDSRLTALFSKGLTITSNPGEGTMVSFSIPKDAQITEEETV
jgi:sensor histidine kinase YesM